MQILAARKVALSILLALIAVAGAGAWKWAQAKKGDDPPPLSGTIEADQVEIGAQRPGRLLKVESAPEFLAPLPISSLDLDAEQSERLYLLGLRTLGAVAGIGPRRLESQLGRAGRRAVLLARGDEPEWLKAWTPPRFTWPHP